LIKDIKAWRMAWEDVLKFQYDASEAFANLYKPIEPASSPDMRHQPAETPAKYMQKCLGLQKEYSDEKADLAQEIALISTKCLRPAEEAKQHTKLLQKTLKHRENMKLDYERYLSRAEHLRKKDQRNAKDETALATHEANLAQAQISYQTADDQVKQTFPPVNEAILSLLPYILANQVMLQTTLVGQLYTVLDAYTRRFGFANPAPANTEILSAWDGEFSALRRELESGIAIIANGKTVHQSMNLPDKDKSTMTGLGIRNKVMNRKDSNQPLPAKPATGGRISSTSLPQQPEAEEMAPPKPPRPGGIASPSIPSMAAAPVPMPSPSINYGSKPKISASPSNGVYGHQQPPPPYGQIPTALTPGYPNQGSDYASGGATPPSRYQTPANDHSPLPSAASNAGFDYFGQRRASQASSIASSAASIAAAKKKPPPPVPTKRIPSQPVQYVTALFDFEGQNSGDLAFREGDRIKVVKKTGSTDDWWDGELAGRVGAFPANYVQL
jgi:amphiphysin